MVTEEATQRAGVVVEALPVMVLLPMEHIRLKEKVFPMDLQEVLVTEEMLIEVSVVEPVVMGRIINLAVEEVDTRVAAVVHEIMAVVVVPLFHQVKIPIFLK